MHCIIIHLKACDSTDCVTDWTGLQGVTNNDGFANMLRRDAVLGLAAFAAEVDDLHIVLLCNIAQGCLKLQQNELALIYANAAMRARDR